MSQTPGFSEGSLQPLLRVTTSSPLPNHPEAPSSAVPWPQLGGWLGVVPKSPERDQRLWISSRSSVTLCILRFLGPSWLAYMVPNFTPRDPKSTISSLCQLG